MTNLSRLWRLPGAGAAGALLAVGSLVASMVTPAQAQTLDGSSADGADHVVEETTPGDSGSGAGLGDPSGPAASAPSDEGEILTREETQSDPLSREESGDEPMVSVKPADGAATFSATDFCQSGLLYGVTSTGSVWSVPEAGGAASKVDTGWYDLYNRWVPTYTSPEIAQKDGVNGLAIASDGTMYAYARGWVYRQDLTGSPSYNLRINMFVKRPDGPWARLNNNDYAVAYQPPWNSPVAGAIDPTSGNFVWGEFRSGNFVIREINVVTGKSYVSGRVPVGIGNGSGDSVNGDVAYDAAGNLYVVAQSGSKMSITTVRAADIAAGRVEKNSYSYWPDSATRGSTVINNYSEGVNGIAVGQDGGLYVSTTKEVLRVDPLTGKLGGVIGANPYIGQNSDLASCSNNTPTTLTLQKELRDQGKTDDQFELSVVHDGATLASATAKTRVSGSTLLKEVTGPTWVSTGARLTLQESGTRLADYTSDLSCVIDGGPEVAVEVDPEGSRGSVIVPPEAAGHNVTCTFTNTPRTDELTARISLTKTGPDGELLAEAKFQLWEDVDNSGSLTDPPDQRVGGTRISDDQGRVEWRYLDPTKSYLIQEVEAPTGYRLPNPAVWKADFAAAVPNAEVALPAGMLPVMPQLQQYLLVGTSTNYEPTVNVNSSENELGKLSEVPWSKVESSIGGWPVTGAANLQPRTSYDGNVAFSRGTKSGSMFEMGTIQMYADLGTASKSTDPFKGTGGYWYPEAGQPRQAISNSKKQDVVGMTALQAELDGLKSYVLGLATEGTASWSGSNPKTINVDSYDTNGDGIAVIGIASKSELKGPHVIAGSGKVFPIFVLSGKDTFKLNNASLQLSEAMAAAFQSRGMGAMFIQTQQTSDPFNFANSLSNGVGFYDLSMAGDGKFIMNNFQACGQFVGQILNFNDVSLSRCAQAPTSVLTIVNPLDSGQAELTLIKEVDNSHGGSAAPDDFSLTATPNGSEALRFTSGEAKAVDPGGYVIGESLLDDYEFVDARCEGGSFTSNLDSVAPNGKSISAGTVVVEAGDHVTCTITNRDLPTSGSVSWEKVDEGEPALHLNASEWVLAGPQGPSSIDRKVTDCVEEGSTECPADSLDRDPRAGYFRVEGPDMKFGRYTLTETKAPVGYELDGQVHSFDLSKDAANHVLGAVVNRQAEGPNLPLAGGVGAWVFALLGGGLLGVATLGGVGLWKRGARTSTE